MLRTMRVRSSMKELLVDQLLGEAFCPVSDFDHLAHIGLKRVLGQRDERQVSSQIARTVFWKSRNALA